MEIYLIRHSTPLIEPGRCYGQSDVPLAPSFAAEWAAIQPTLPPAIDHLISSPLQRCRQLADALAMHYRMDYHTDARLQELHFGRWEMQRWDEIDPIEWMPWMADYLRVPCPGGESYADLLARVRDFTDEFRQRPCQRVLLVTHAGVIRSFYAVLRGLEPEVALQTPVRYGEIHQFIT